MRNIFKNRHMFKKKNITLKNKYYDDKLKTERKNFFKFIRSELQSSTTHGLPYIVDPKLRWTDRLFWSLGFIFSLAILYILLSSQFSRYLSSPTVVSVEMDYFEWNVSYPALTLCPILKSNFSTFKKFVNDISNKYGINLEQYVWAINSAAEQTLITLALLEPNNSNPIPPEDFAKTAALLYDIYKVPDLSTNSDWSVSVDIVMTEKGMCHVFNSNVAAFDNPLKWNNKETVYKKNNIELSVFDADFFVQITNYAPVYSVFIHSPDESILSTTPSYLVEAEGIVSFGFQVWSSKISKELQTTSISTRKCRLLHEPISKRYPIYSYTNCLLECRIKLILKLCGCVPHFYKPTGKERTCKLSELKCFIYYKREIMSLSVSNDTLKRFSNSKDLPKSARDCKCLSSCETDIYRKDSEEYTSESSTNELKVIITSFPKVRILRDIIFRFNDIFLRSGGVINLCIGSSIISIMELLVIFVRISVYLLWQVIIRVKDKIWLNIF